MLVCKSHTHILYVVKTIISNPLNYRPLVTGTYGGLTHNYGVITSTYLLTGDLHHSCK